ncbi:MAG: HAD family hydrolase [Bacteroidetes bacterium]|nr:HAD family hydrolase [Bacteroidota bacterium]
MSNLIKYVFFDVANTLLHKPLLFTTIQNCLLDFNYKIDLEKIKYNHKFLCEIYDFPDKTSEAFYNNFNADLVLLLGIEPKEELIKHIFFSCKNMPWETFEDVGILNEISQNLGIISNWDSSLEHKLQNYFGDIFKIKFVSEVEKVRKPNLSFYKKIIKTTGLKPNEILYVGDSLKLDYIPSTLLGINSLIIDRDNIFKQFCPHTIGHLNEIKKHLA